VRNLNEKFHGSLHENSRKKDDAHPDFVAKLTLWGTVYSAAAWLSKTSKGQAYIALHLTSESQGQAEKIKFAIWKNYKHATPDDAHFQSVQEVFGRQFTLKAWFLPKGSYYRLELTIEPEADANEVSDAMPLTREKISHFLSETQLPALAAAQRVPSLPADPQQQGETPDDIPF
jgi:hypothetical protein